MAKTKQKNKNLGTDILYRIIMAAMAVCVPIVAYFGNLVYTVIESDIYKLVAKLKGDSSDDGTSYDYWSIKRVVSLVHRVPVTEPLFYMGRSVTGTRCAARHIDILCDSSSFGCCHILLCAYKQEENPSAHNFYRRACIRNRNADLL